MSDEQRRNDDLSRMYALVASVVTALASSLAGLAFLTTISPAFSSPRSTCPTSPTRWSVLDVLECYRRILAKSLFRLVGLLKPSLSLPEIVIDAPLIIDEATVAAYRAATDAGEGDETPLLFVAATTPMFLLLLAHPICPIAALGSVNTVSKFEMLDPEAAKGYKDGEWNVRAYLGREARRVKRGIDFDAHAEVRKGPVGSTDGKIVFRQTFSALHFLPKSHPPPPPEAKPEPEKPELEASDLTVQVDQSHIWRWAGCTSDYQPIHTSPFLAKYAFGLPTSIAHGNLVVATFLQSLGRTTPQHGTRASTTTPAAAAREAVFGGSGKWTASAAFKRPVTVGSHLVAKTGKRDDGAVGFALFKGEKPCIEGEVKGL